MGTCSTIGLHGAWGARSLQITKTNGYPVTTHCPPIVTRAYFDRAQRIRLQRANGPEREAVLEQLRSIYQHHGTINIALCRSDLSLPGGSTIIELFGGYLRAYAAAGLPPLRTAKGALSYRTSRLLAADLLGAVERYADQAGGSATTTKWNNILLLNNAVHVKIAVAANRLDGAGRPRWRIPLRVVLPADFVLCGLTDRENTTIERYVLLAPNQFTHDAMFLTERSMVRVADACFDNLAQIFGIPSDST